jgi:hypothetical protein
VIIIANTPIRAIRARCIECVGQHYSLIRNCEHLDCPLFRYRLGTNPARKGIGGRKKLPLENPLS